jgi:hypothetical protein
MVSEAYRGEAMKRKMLLSGINGSERACMSKSQMTTVLIAFFDIKDTVHFEFKAKQSTKLGNTEVVV